MYTWTLVFGAELLWSVLPLLILLSSFANHRIDDDLSEHIGLDHKGALIIKEAFRNTPEHAAIPILTGLLFSLAGTIAVVQSLQVLYERIFEQQPRGWRDLPRVFAWLVALLGFLVLEAEIGHAVRTAVGPVVGRAVSFVVVTLFFGGRSTSCWRAKCGGGSSWSRRLSPGLGGCVSRCSPGCSSHRIWCRTAGITGRSASSSRC